MDVFTIFLSTVFVNNIILAQYLGCCPFLGCSKQRGVALGMGAAVMFVIILATLCTWLIQRLLLNPLGLEYLQTIAFILVIASLVQLVEMFLKKMVPPLYKALGIFLPLITTNCAVLGVAIMMQTDKLDLIPSLVNAFGYSLGYGMALLLMAGIRERLETVHIPKSVAGTPAGLVLAGLMSLAFMAFKGMV